jgi:hypothetical protein
VDAKTMQSDELQLKNKREGGQNLEIMKIQKFGLVIWLDRIPRDPQLSLS